MTNLKAIVRFLAIWLPAFFIILAMMNFLSFVLTAAALGGDALNGKVVDGHYFLSEHGQLTEVSETIYNYSRWHAISVMITHPLMILIAAVLFFKHKRKILTFFGRGSSTDPRKSLT